MKKILILLCLLLFSNMVFAAESRDYSNITKDSKIKQVLNNFSNERILYLNGKNPTNAPITIEFTNFDKLDIQYSHPFILTYRDNNNHVHIYINDICKSSGLNALFALLRDRMYETDSITSLNEEIYYMSGEAASWIVQTSVAPYLEKENDVLVSYLNKVKYAYINCNYSSENFNDIISNYYNNITQETSPRFETMKLYPLADKYKNPTCIKDYSIIEAVEEIKNAPMGKELYNKIMGSNFTHRPITIEFKKLNQLDKRYSRSPAMWYYDGEKLYIYINDFCKYDSKEVLATLIMSRLSVEDSVSSINEETYWTTVMAASWTYFTNKKPELLKTLNPFIRCYLNTYMDLYKKGNYTDEYIRLAVKSQKVYKYLPETSPGYETRKQVDNSMFDVVTVNSVKDSIKDSYNKAQTIHSTNLANKNAILKGIFYNPEIKVDLEKYNNKLKIDNSKYIINKKELSQEQYHLYRILERIVRANNIDFIPWRLEIEDNYSVNAASTDINLVIINRGLYNKFKNNDDALAFVISHELAHLLLNHMEITAKNNQKIYAITKRSAMRTNNMYNGIDMAYNIEGDDTAAMIARIGFAVYAAINGIQATTDQLAIDKIYEAERQLEYDADNEGFNLMFRAGYNLGGAAETFEILSSYPNVYTRRSTHPPVRDRAINLREVGSAMNYQLKNEGKNNLTVTNALKCHSNNYHTVFLIEETPNHNRNYYPETEVQRYQRIADARYRNYQLISAIHYLKILNKKQPNNFVHPLRISYANEYLYKKTQENKYYKQAQFWSKKANKIAPKNKYVIEQINNIKSLK